MCDKLRVLDLQAEGSCFELDFLPPSLQIIRATLLISLPKESRQQAAHLRLYDASLCDSMTLEDFGIVSFGEFHTISFCKWINNERTSKADKVAHLMHSFDAVSAIFNSLSHCIEFLKVILILSLENQMQC